MATGLLAQLKRLVRGRPRRSQGRRRSRAVGRTAAVVSHDSRRRRRPGQRNGSVPPHLPRRFRHRRRELRRRRRISQRFRLRDQRRAGDRDVPGTRSGPPQAARPAHGRNRQGRFPACRKRGAAAPAHPGTARDQPGRRGEAGGGLHSFWLAVIRLSGGGGQLHAAATDSSIATGTWSDGFSQARTCLSIDAETRRLAASGESSRWSMRMPLSFCQAPA